MRCPNCGEELTGGEMICPNCRLPVNDGGMNMSEETYDMTDFDFKQQEQNMADLYKAAPKKGFAGLKVPKVLILILIIAAAVYGIKTVNGLYHKNDGIYVCDQLDGVLLNELNAINSSELNSTNTGDYKHLVVDVTSNRFDMYLVDKNGARVNVVVDGKIDFDGNEVDLNYGSKDHYYDYDATTHTIVYSAKSEKNYVYRITRKTAEEEGEFAVDEK